MGFKGVIFRNGLNLKNATREVFPHGIFWHRQSLVRGEIADRLIVAIGNFRWPYFSDSDQSNSYLRIDGLLIWHPPRKPDSAVGVRVGRGVAVRVLVGLGVEVEVDGATRRVAVGAEACA